jgi:SAM-dependent methyltransferase
MSQNWDGRSNFTSYDDVETPENYPTRAALEAYRSERLAIGWTRAEFTLKISDAPRPATVVEIGSGSSALLYALHLRGLLKSGIGIELSESRHRFAESWKADEGFASVINRSGDFATLPLADNDADMVLCLDNTFSYLGPENEAYPRRLAEKAFLFLRPGGTLIIDTHNQEKLIASLENGERQLWIELPSSNAFKFALYRQSFNREKGWIRSESIYLKADGSERRKVDLETGHDRAAIERLLLDASFADLRSYGDYDASEFDMQRSDRLIVAARKPMR